jgi:hypothetical protein
MALLPISWNLEINASNGLLGLALAPLPFPPPSALLPLPVIPPGPLPLPVGIPNSFSIEPAYS